MKKLFFSLFVCFVASVALSAQESRRLTLSVVPEFGSMKLNANIGNTSAFEYGAESYGGIGVQAAIPIADRWDIVSGVSYAWSSGSFWGTTPEISIGMVMANLKILTIPALMRYHFGKYFFADGGFYYHNVRAEDSENLLGAGIGIGAAYTFASGMRIAIRPQIRWSGVISDYKMTQYGAEASIGYQF
jgi:hypothetical protein